MEKRDVLVPERKNCRVSKESLQELFTLGKLYVSDFIPTGEESHHTGMRIELKLCLARKSGLVQLAHTTPADIMYRRYWYKSGTNLTMTRELEEIAELAQRLCRHEKGDVFLDIGCNDGTLLKFLSPNLIRIGFDPNDYKAESEKYANLIVNDYFSRVAYAKTKYGKKKAKIVTSIAMFYDLEDPHTFVEEVKKILHTDGLWIIQMSYLPLMLKQLAFDNICHEHVEYYSLTALSKLLEHHKLEVVDCQVNDVNGGSFRVFVRHQEADETKFAMAPYRDVAKYRVESILAYEKTLALTSAKTYKDFYRKICDLKKKTVAFVLKEKKKGKTIWGYGASTKGNTLLQWFGLNHTLIDGIAERSPAKYGLKTIGTNIPIYSEEDMRKHKPDYLLVLPWHFISEFKEREKKFLARGGKFIVPCPRFEIIGKE